MSANSNLTEPQQRKLDVLLLERSDGRKDLTELERNMIQTACYLAGAIGAGLASAVARDRMPAGAWDALMLGFSQIEFFLAMVCIFALWNWALRAGHLAAIDDGINRLLRSRISVRESLTTERFIVSWPSAYVVLCILMGVFVYGSFLWFLILAWTTSMNPLLGVVIAELTIPLAFILAIPFARN